MAIAQRAPHFNFSSDVFGDGTAPEGCAGREHHFRGTLLVADYWLMLVCICNTASMGPAFIRMDFMCINVRFLALALHWRWPQHRRSRWIISS